MIKSKKGKIIMASILVLAIIYLACAELTLQASLNPAFMERLDAFSSFTEKGYAEQVKSADIDENAKASSDETYAWLKEMAEDGWTKYQMESDEGFMLVASCFMQKGEAAKTAPWAMVLHGYTGWKEEMYPYAYNFYKAGYNVLVPDMRAQGESEGKYIGLGWADKADNLKWLSYITKNYPGSEIVIYGLSMGGAASLMLSADEALPSAVKCVIADSAFTDAKSMFKNKVHDWVGLPTFGLVDTAGLLLKLQGGYDLNDASALKAVAKAKVPILFIGGTDDKTVPISNLYALYEACSTKKEQLVISGAGHGQCADKEPELFYSSIFSFIDEN